MAIEDLECDIDEVISMALSFGMTHADIKRVLQAAIDNFDHNWVSDGIK